jgi:hypothetical protein
VEVKADGTQTTVGSGLSAPVGVAVDGSGDVFIADSGNNRAVEVKADGTQTTIGSGLNYPEGVAVDGAGDIFIADTYDSRVEEVKADGTQTTVGSLADELSYPQGVAVDGSGDVFIADTGNGRVVEVHAGVPVTVRPATLTITPAAGQSKVYGAALRALTYTASGFVNNDHPSILHGSLGTTATAASSVGSYAFTLGTLSAGANYSLAIASHSPAFAVAPATLTVTANNASRHNGAGNPTFTYTVTGFVNGDTARVIRGSPVLGTTATLASPQGNYPITAGLGTLAAANYTFALANGTLTIEPAPLRSIAVSPANPEVRQGQRERFTATGTFADNTTENLSSQVSWSSSSNSVASITAMGLATGVAAGSSTISAVFDGVTGSTALTITAPQLVTLSQVKDIFSEKGHLVTEILVTFSGPVNATEATDTAIYHLAEAGKGGSFTAKSAKTINLVEAVHNAATDTVSLIPKKPFSLKRPVQLTIKGTAPGGLQDRFGRLIDGADNGKPGSNAFAVFVRKGVTIT